MAPEDPTALLYALAAILVAAYVVRWKSDPLKSIPTVGGPSMPILSLIGAFNYLIRAKDLISEGHHRYRGSVFKIAQFTRWIVVVNGSKLVDDLRKRPDELSFEEGTEEVLQLKYTLTRESINDPYHVEIIREKLMRTLSMVLPDVIDELATAVPDYIPIDGDEWTTVKVMPAMQKIVARLSNRVFVGPTLCRDQKYTDLAIRFAVDVIKDRVFIVLFPPFLRSLVGALTSTARKNVLLTARHFKPVLDERRMKMEELGDSWEDRPNDLLQWVFEEALPRRSTYEEIAERILLVNFAAIHTSSNTVAHALYDIAANPEWLKPLREEVEPIIAAEGWTKAALGKMDKVDSVLKEVLRHRGIGLLSMLRIAVKDVTLSDGTFIPKDTFICTSTWGTHRDDVAYPDPEVFDPFRFSRGKKDGVSGTEGTKHLMSNVSADFVPFGYGGHACPGRFFAASELKALLAFLVINYDFKLADGEARPSTFYFADAVIPNPSAKLLFRKRKDIGAKQ